jgi:p-aminobenzoyl-glutamate transporter AbgT
LTGFLSKVVKTFTDSLPLGTVVGLAEQTGFIRARLTMLLRSRRKTADSQCIPDSIPGGSHGKNDRQDNN